MSIQFNVSDDVDRLGNTLKDDDMRIGEDKFHGLMKGGMSVDKIMESTI